MIDLSQYHLKEKYRKVLEHLSDDDKVRVAIENYNFQELKDIVIYYDLQDNPLLKTLALPKYGKDPRCAYEYARYVIKGRFPEAEPYIKTDPHYACEYARYVIKGRFPEAEDVIKTHPETAYGYARNVIKDRWFEAENIIKTDPRPASWYALSVIKGRWPEAEECIRWDGYSADRYAKHVMKDENFWYKKRFLSGFY